MSMDANFHCLFMKIMKKFDIANCTDKYKNEFEEISNWLRFGFHALNSKADYEKYESASIVNDYNKVLENLERIVRKKRYN